MVIICCSKDNVLKKKLISQFKGDEVVSRPSIDQLLETDLQQGNVVIVDLKYSALQENITCPLPIIALATMPVFPECALLLQRGVRGYGNRQMREENIAQAVQTVKAGQIWLPPNIISELIARVGDDTETQPSSPVLDALSEREQEVAQYVAKGMSNQEMADKMFVSLRTVKAHLSSIYEKTGLRNRLELGLKLKK